MKDIACGLEADAEGPLHSSWSPKASAAGARDQSSKAAGGWGWAVTRLPRACVLPCDTWTGRPGAAEPLIQALCGLVPQMPSPQVQRAGAWSLDSESSDSSHTLAV